MLLLRTLLLSLFFSLPAHASTLAEELSVFKLSTSVKILLLKYYHVQADEGNPQLVEEVLRHREEVSLQKSLLLEDLQRYRHGEEVSVYWYSGWEKLVRWNSRHAYSIIALLSALTGAGLWALFGP